MNSQRIVFIHLILLLTFQLCFAQEKLQPIKIDEIRETSCADLQNRIDIGFREMAEDPNSVGYIVVNGKKNDLFANLLYENWIIGLINKIARDKNQYKVVRGEDKEKFIVELWKVSVGSNTKFYSEGRWSYVLPISTKPFIFTAYSWRDSGICPMGLYVKLFADFLSANPNARGHLVIRDKTDKNFRGKEKEILDELVNQHKVPRHRLRLFYDRNENYPYTFTDVEFWFVPKSKNRLFYITKKNKS